MMRIYIYLLIFTVLALPAFSQTLPPYIPGNGLVAWYPFNGNANDESGNRNHGIVHGATPAPDRFGNENSGFSFNGTSAYIDVRDTSTLNPTSAISISLWLKTDASHGFAGIIGKWNNFGGSVGAGHEQFRFDVSDTNSGMNFEVDTEENASVAIRENPVIYNNGKWNHYVGVYDGSNIMLYVNGKKITSLRYMGKITVYKQALEIGRIAGGMPTCATNFYFTGNIDDVAIWNRGLTAKEITAIYTWCPGFIKAVITPRTAASFCQGGSVTLDATTAPEATYQWFLDGILIDGATNSSYTASKAGKYTVTVSGGECSSTSEPLQVAVSPFPDSTVGVSGQTTFCPGESVTLSAPAAANTTYSWNNGETTRAVSVTRAGTYSVTVTTGGCSSTSQPVTVDVKPGPAAGITVPGATDICDGGSVTLTATGGETYLWSTGETGETISADKGGTYSVKVTAGGCTATASRTVTIYPLPEVTLAELTNYIDILSEPVPLSGTPPGGSFSGDGVVSGNFSPSLAGLGKKNVIYSFTSPQGCTNTSSRQVIVCDTTGIHCTKFDTLEIIHYDTLKVTLYDTLKVTLYDTLRVTRYDTLLIMQSVTVADTVVIKALLTGSGQSISLDLIKIYPNPAKTHLNILFSDFARENGHILRIRNSAGQDVFQSEITRQVYTINLSSWTGKGLYLVYLEDQLGTIIEVKKIILE